MNTLIEGGPVPLTDEHLLQFDMYRLRPALLPGAKLTLICHYFVRGNPQSKANSRKAVWNKRTRKPMFIKSDAARDYERKCMMQTPIVVPLCEHKVVVFMKVWYMSQRSDLDESLILDCMQRRIIVNDKQVVARYATKAIDAINPRASILVAALDFDKPVSTRKR